MLWNGPIKSISVRLPEDLHAAVKSAAPLRSGTVERAYTEALDSWLERRAATKENANLSPQNPPIIGDLGDSSNLDKEVPLVLTSLQREWLALVDLAYVRPDEDWRRDMLASIKHQLEIVGGKERPGGEPQSDPVDRHPAGGIPGAPGPGGGTPKSTPGHRKKTG